MNTLCIKLDQDGFFPYPFQSIILHSLYSFDSILFSLLTASLNMP